MSRPKKNKDKEEEKDKDVAPKERAPKERAPKEMSPKEIAHSNISLPVNSNEDEDGDDDQFIEEFKSSTTATGTTDEGEDKFDQVKFNSTPLSETSTDELLRELSYRIDDFILVGRRVNSGYRGELIRDERRQLKNHSSPIITLYGDPFTIVGLMKAAEDYLRLAIESDLDTSEHADIMDAITNGELDDLLDDEDDSAEEWKRK